MIGLPWEAVDLDAGTVTIRQTRGIVGSRVVVKPKPKSARGQRTLPIDPATVSALRAFRAVQARERLAAGTAYQSSGLVAVNELGEGIHPEAYRRRFARIAAAAGLPKITEHGMRHTANQLLADASVPAYARAAFLGHRVDVNVAVYTHGTDDAIAVASGAPAKIIGGQS